MDNVELTRVRGHIILCVQGFENQIENRPPDRVNSNVKRIRLYREECLSLRLKRPRRNKATKLRHPKQLAHAINQIWSIDFVDDALFDGRKLRMLTAVDLFTRECLAIDVGQSLKGEDVVRVLTAISQERGLPRTIKSNNGPEFVSHAILEWISQDGIATALSGPGKPWQNGTAESSTPKS